MYWFCLTKTISPTTCIFDDRIERDTIKALKKRKWEWVRFIKKEYGEIIIPWDASLGRNKLHINSVPDAIESCIEMIIESDESESSIHLSHFYYQHVHPLSNISQGKVMMDVCKSFAYACGCQYMTLQDASYNMIKKLYSKNIYAHDRLSKTVETLLRKGTTVYRMYGFDPDDGVIQFQILDGGDEYVDMQIKWVNNQCFAHVYVDDEKLFSGTFEIIYNKIVKPLIECIANTPTIWYGEKRIEYAGMSVRSVLEDGYRDFMSRKNAPKLSSPFLSPGSADTEAQDFEWMMNESEIGQLEDFEDVVKAFDFDD